jgi:hypothetical protein
MSWSQPLQSKVLWRGRLPGSIPAQPLDSSVELSPLVVANSSLEGLSSLSLQSALEDIIANVNRLEVAIYAPDDLSLAQATARREANRNASVEKYMLFSSELKVRHALEFSLCLC